MKARAATGSIDGSAELTTEESKEVFANFGLAIHVSNILEFAMLNALFAVELFPKMRSFESVDEWNGAFDQFYDHGYAQTFGNLLRNIKKSEEFPRHLLELLEVCKEVRDNLSHRFMRESAELFFSETGRQLMIQSCENAVSLFGSANNELEEHLSKKYADLGVDMERFEQRITEGMEELISRSNEK